MKYKILLPTLALCASSVFLAPASADNDKGTRTDASLENLGDVRIGNLINAKVKNSAGERIGQIEDFVVNPNSGRIEFAVLKLAKGGDYTPIPWPLLSKSCVDLNRSGEPKMVVLDVEQSRFDGQKFSINKWPDSHPMWGQDVYTYYGVPWETPVVSATGATGNPTVVVDSGTAHSYPYSDRYDHRNPRDRDSNWAKPIDNGTAPDGKDVFKFSPRPWPYSEYRHE